MSLYIVVNMVQPPTALTTDDLGVHTDYPEDPGVYTDYEKALTDAVVATQFAAQNGNATFKVFRLEPMEAHVASVAQTHWVCPVCWVLVSKGQTCACGKGQER